MEIGSESSDYRESEMCCDNDYYFAYDQSTHLRGVWLMINRVKGIRQKPACRHFKKDCEL